MILADKIIALRKKNGWSQEELAEKMDVSRQSVSKWEGAQSVPDLDKIVRLSQIFGVTIDFLLKDEYEEVEYTEETAEPEKMNVRRVTMEEANDFLDVKEATGKWIALAVFMCIISPVCLMLLAVAQELHMIPISENAAAGMGVIALLLIIATAVAIFIFCGMQTNRFEYLKKEVFETEYGVIGMIKERQKQYKDTYTICMAIGTVLSILSVVPLFVALCFTEDDFVMVSCVCLLLFLVGIGVIFFVRAGIVWESLKTLLQEGDYTREKKRSGKVLEAFENIYWLVILAAYLGYSFYTFNWARSWIIWPVAGILYAVAEEIISAFCGRKE